jgi:MarR family transcriptional regulator for hemolysin
MAPQVGSITSLVARTRRVLRRRFVREVAQLSPRPPDLLRALYVIAEEELPTQGSLAGRLDLDAPAASRLVASLVSEGLVERETGVDRRCRSLRITEEGQKVLVPVRAAIHKVDGDIELALGTQQAESLRRLLTRVLRACDDERPGQKASDASSSSSG